MSIPWDDGGAVVHTFDAVTAPLINLRFPRCVLATDAALTSPFLA